jgi:alpha-glucosidase
MKQKHNAPIIAALLAGFALLAAQPAFAADALALASPNGQVRFRLFLGDDARLHYAVSFRNQPVIEESPLGIVVDGANLAEGVSTARTERYRATETYPWYGVHSTAVDRSNGAKIQLQSGKAEGAYTLEVRAYDDAIAFRFIVPGPGEKPRVPDEATVFRLPPGSTVWYHDFEGHYEGVHVKRTIEQAAAGEWAAPPLTFKLPAAAGYGSITEAALFHYAGMGLQADGRNGFAARLGHSVPPSYPFRLRFKQDIERMAKPASIAGTITSPWRVVMIGADLNALVNCDVVHNLAPPPDPRYFPQGLKTEWLKPGRAVWRYLDGGDNSFEGMKQFSKLAAELGFEYNVLEGFWQKWSEQQLKEMVDYSRGLGVGIVLWKHSGELRDAKSQREFFDLCRRNGVAGAKIDFFDHEAKEVVELYETLLRQAAEAHMIIDFHGANKPTGESRTWPNEMTREAIRGMESRKVERAPHDATLPFTRMLAGHADYTPTVFSERRNDTTWAHQIATAAIFTSPLLVYGGHPRSFLENPAVEVIKSIPSVWDETIVLPVSQIGEVAAFARRRGQTWFVAIANGTAARTVSIDLSFLGTGSYHAVLAGDDKDNPAAVKVETATVTRKDSRNIALSAGGGFVARFTLE